MPEPFTCKDLHRAGYWDTRDCCEDCHNEDELFNCDNELAMVDERDRVGTGIRSLLLCCKAFGDRTLAQDSTIPSFWDVIDKVRSGHHA